MARLIAILVLLAVVAILFFRFTSGPAVNPAGAPPADVAPMPAGALNMDYLVAWGEQPITNVSSRCGKLQEQASEGSDPK